MSEWAGKTPTAEQWRDILEQHARWLRSDGGSRADLTRAVLRGADLTGADLTGAVLTGADLTRAVLTDADLTRAVLTRADLTGAVLRDVRGAGLVIAQTRILPAGELIGWKKCDGGVLVRLRIPADTRRSHAFGRKCRAEFVDVLEVIDAEVGITSSHGPKTEYRAGMRVLADSWDDNFMDECSHGIHFFITEEEAEAYE